MTRSFKKAAKRRLVMMRRRRHGSESHHIGALISPLRYDVLIRAQFLQATRAAGFRTPGTEFHAFALSQPYLTWFKHIECVRFFPDVLNDPTALIQRYLWRADRALSTMRSYDRIGFDPRFPITLGTTSGGARTDSGVRVSNTLHVRDGCHRLALLLAGGSLLEPHMYRVHRMTGTVPDNTALLLPWLDITDGEYVGFLAPAFVQTSHRSLLELRAAVDEHSPERLREFDEIVRFHQASRRAPSAARRNGLPIAESRERWP